MPEGSNSQSKTVTLKLHMNRAPRLTVIYKGKHDLFEKFKKRTQELGIPAETVFWIDDDGEPVRLDNANTLMGAAEESSTLRLYACDTDDEESSCSSCDELAVGRRPWKRGRHRARSHSRCRSRDHSRGGRSHSAERSRSRDHSHRHHHHGSCPFSDFETSDYSMTDSRYGLYPPFACCARGGFGGRGAFGRRGGFGSRGGGLGRGFHLP